jgi:aminoglycoside phosphotransferase (APT) family kinase protein
VFRVSRADIERLCLEVVPGTGAVEIRPLGTGLTCETYRVVRDDVAYALKTAAERSPDLGLSLVWEASLLTHASTLKLAPPLVYCDVERAVMVSRWVTGRPWEAEDVRRPANLLKLSELLRRVHALPAPAPPRVMSPLSWIEVYGAALWRIGCPVDATLRVAAESRLQQFSRLPPSVGVVCHSDLHRMNLIQDGEMLTLLDWEYAHVSDPSWDLAGWAANNDFDAQARRELLGNYLNAVPSDSQWMRLGLLMWLYDYVCLLWSDLYRNTRGGQAREITQRATLLDARLRLPAHYWP